MTDAERRSALDAIAGEVAVCTRCRLHQTRTRAVPGEGNPDTEVMFVGEGPGFNEDRQGRPFVGRAGDLLEKLLASIGWTRNEVFIANVVKCRPPENRDPEPDEIAACSPFLTRQMQALDPALVVTLGRFSMARFSPGARIGQVHGTYRTAPVESGAPDALVYFMYHPAAALRDPGVEAMSFRDMAGVPAALIASRKLRASRIATEAPAQAPAESAIQDEPIDAEPGPAEVSDPATGAKAPNLPKSGGETHASTELSAEENAGAAIHSVATDAESDPTDQLTLF